MYSDEDNKEVTVKLATDNYIICEYPVSDNGIWNVIANKDGTIIDKKTGVIYNYLFWEGLSTNKYNFNTGFCIKGEDSAVFLENTLDKLGLSREEANEFIVYWLPILESSAYNLISFQTEVYTNSYVLDVEPVDIVEQDLDEVSAGFKRDGFYVVEWGGCEVD